MGVTKKTVVLDDRIERYVRLTQAILLEAEPPVVATYSAAVNFMLLAAIHETARPGGIWEETSDIIWDFARDIPTTRTIALHEQMEAVRRAFLEGEHGSANEAI